MKSFTTVLLAFFLFTIVSANKVDSLIALIKNDYDTANYGVYKALHFHFWGKEEDSALIYSKLGLSQAEKQQNELQIGLFKSRIGSVYFNMGMMAQASEYFKSSYIISLKLGDTLSSLIRAGNYGMAQINLGNYTEAGDILFGALEIAEKIGDLKELSHIYSNLGLLHFKQNNYELSINYFKKSLTASKILGEDRIMTFTYKRIGNLFQHINQYDSAKYYYKASLETSIKTNYIIGQLEVYCYLGELFLKMGNKDSALVCYNQELHLRKSYKTKWGDADFYETWGLYFLHNAEIDKALGHFHLALKFYLKEGLRNRVKSLYFDISKAHKAAHNYDSALYYYELYTALTDSLFNVEKSRQITELETIYQTEQKEKEILELKGEQEKKHSQTVLLIAALVFVTLISALSFVFYRSRQRSKEMEILALEQKKQFGAVLVAQEEERKRIAAELHDSVGQLLSLTSLYISDAVDHIKNGTDEGPESLSRSMVALQEAIRETRSISHNLMPGALVRKGLSAACRELVRRINDTNLLDISFQEQSIKEQPSEQLSIVYYRVLQELVSNIIKHSGATRAKVCLKQDNGSLVMEVKDNGKGFDLINAKKNNGLGLQNIYSRLDLVNGHVYIDTTMDKGSSFVVTAPFNQ